MKKLLCTLLGYTLAVPPSYVLAAGPAGEHPSIQTAVTRVAQTVPLEAAAKAPTSASGFPRSLPRRGKRFNQGGPGAGMMVFSLLSTVAGAAGTYYVIKTMRDSNKEQTGAAGFR